MKNKIYALILFITCIPLHGYPQVSIPAIGDTVIIDFTGFTGSGFSPSPAAGQLSSNDWSVRGFSDDTLLDFGETDTAGDFARGISTGGETTGGIYAFDIGGGNMMLGVQPTGSDFTSGTFALKIQNNTPDTIFSMDAAYTIWYYNDQDRSSSLNFSWSTDNIFYNAVSSLDFTTPAPLDSPASWQMVNRATLITGLIIAPGALFYLRWRGNDAGGSGSRDEYGIDDIAIIAHSAVTANFTAADVCQGDSVYFTDNSSTVNGSIITWKWYFGDGDSSLLQNPAHYFSSAGTYPVILFVTDNLNYTGAVSKTVSVFPNPSAAFTAANFCQGNPVQFTDQSTIATGTVAAWSWDFGDSSVSFQQNPNHFYPDTGDYIVSHAVISDKGCTDSVAYSIIIIPSPSISAFGPIITNTACGSADGSISGIGVTGTPPMTYQWTNSTGTLVGDSATLDSMPADDYTLVVINSNGCTDTAGPFSIVDTIGAPTPYAGIDDTVCGLNTDLYGSTGGGLIQWSLVNGPGTVIYVDPSMDTTSTAVSAYGTYTIRITETNGSCSGYDDVTITFSEIPVAGFTFTTNGPTVSFTNISTGGTFPVIYSWDFGDGTGTSNLGNPSYTYASTGAYNVCLSVDDAAGCSGGYCDSVDVIVFALNDKATGKTMSVWMDNAGGEILLMNYPGENISTVEVYNSIGEKILSAIPVRGAVQYGFPFPYPAGLYFMRITDKKNTEVWEFIK